MRKGLGGSFYKIFVGVLLSRNTRCGRGRACFVVVGKMISMDSKRYLFNAEAERNGSCLYIPYLGY